MSSELFLFDRSRYPQSTQYLAGVDEAGRGPWAGPVVAAAVILPANIDIPGLNDSKKLSPRRREDLFAAVHAAALAVGVGIADHAVIDTENILQATFRAMRDALRALHLPVGRVLIDGAQVIPGLTVAQEAVIAGDAQSACIAAASIIAKVTRDRMMDAFAAEYPQYAFDRHKGYGTAAHAAALKAHGPSPIHRRSFAPVRAVIEAAHA